MAIPNFNDIFNKRAKGGRDSNMPDKPPMNLPLPGNYTGDIVDPSTSMPSSATPAEYQKYLYDSGLQNVFNNYQQNIATLNQQEQSRLQDAYTIREMSRKYLGEYASNLGINDVSGNLIDIYSQYQQNIGEITEQSDMMALNLQQEFQRQQEQAFQQSLQQMELQISENAQTALFNITTNNIGDMSWTEYLQSQLDSGEIDQNSYQQIYTNVYSAKMDTLQGNISSGFFGFKTDESGNRVPMTASEYLEENRDWLNPADFQQLSDLINYSGDQAGGGFDALTWAQVPENLKIFLPEGESVYTLTEGDQTFYYARMREDVDSDDFAGDVSSSDLTTSFLDENQGEPLISGQTIYQYQGTNYVYIDRGREGAGWYRLFNTSNFYNSTLGNIDNEMMKGWNSTKYVANELITDFFTYDKYDEEIRTTGGVVWEKDTDFKAPADSFNTSVMSGSMSAENKAIWQAFADASPKGYPQRYQIVLYNGVFYTIGHSGKVQRFKKRLD